MLIITIIVATTALACTLLLAATWLRTAEMAATDKMPERPRASATAALTIEYAALKERVRKLERIADGVEG